MTTLAGPVGFYNYPLVALSIFIAILAAYAALNLAGRVTTAHGRRKLIWLGGWPALWARASGPCITWAWKTSAIHASHHLNGYAMSHLRAVLIHPLFPSISSQYVDMQSAIPRIDQACELTLVVEHVRRKAYHFHKDPALLESES